MAVHSLTFVIDYFRFIQKTGKKLFDSLANVEYILFKTKWIPKKTISNLNNVMSY